MGGKNVHFIINSIDINALDKIEDDIYERLKGSFKEIMASQNGSRGLQKSLKTTPSYILTKIFNEVY